MKLTPTIKAIGKDIKEILGHIANLRSDVADLKSKGGGEAAAVDTSNFATKGDIKANFDASLKLFSTMRGEITKLTIEINKLKKSLAELEKGK